MHARQLRRVQECSEKMEHIIKRYINKNKRGLLLIHVCIQLLSQAWLLNKKGVCPLQEVHRHTFFFTYLCAASCAMT